MLIVQVCVGSSCYLKGSEEIVNLLNSLIRQYEVEDKVVLAGSFCSGQCNRKGVTVQVDDDVYPGITKEDFKSFFAEKIMAKIRGKDA